MVFRSLVTISLRVSQVEAEQYALPTANYLFKTLNGRKKFTKFNLRQAYEQLVLNEKYREYVLFYTHEELYGYKRLSYGITSAPAICRSKWKFYC